jgi:hypothetical protein
MCSNEQHINQKKKIIDCVRGSDMWYLWEHKIFLKGICTIAQGVSVSCNNFIHPQVDKYSDSVNLF